jgi:hypothetical protein
MWDVALPLVQPTADRGGFGEVWKEMCQTKATNAAAIATNAAAIATNAAAHTANADAYAYTASAANEATNAAANATHAATNAIHAATTAAASAAAAVVNAVNATRAANEAVAAWATLDPVGLLRRLVGATATVNTETKGEYAMITQYTPGPWESSRDAVPEGYAQATVYEEATGVRVATAFESEANARLIAAAPDLLAACQEYVGWLDWHSVIRDEADGACPFGTLLDAQDAVRSAIARAISE